mmetsp:Transcript_42109/g.134587  ORF Transcript_42109/g.134587 Transcript_42109/m.134587 type:complete len:201 (-) Transcript_42109:490-1092(-)
MASGGGASPSVPSMPRLLGAVHVLTARSLLQVVTLLLRAGAKIDQLGKGCCTALGSAARNGHAAVVEQLLAAGADVNVRDKSGETALMDASKTPKNADVVRILLRAKGVHVDLKDPSGGTALAHAAEAAEGNCETIRLLLGAGANVGAACGHLARHGKGGRAAVLRGAPPPPWAPMGMARRCLSPHPAPSERRGTCMAFG